MSPKMCDPYGAHLSPKVFGPYGVHVSPKIVWPLWRPCVTQIVWLLWRPCVTETDWPHMASMSYPRCVAPVASMCHLKCLTKCVQNAPWDSLGSPGDPPGDFGTIWSRFWDVFGGKRPPKWGHVWTVLRHVFIAIFGYPSGAMFLQLWFQNGSQIGGFGWSFWYLFGEPVNLDF